MFAQQTAECRLDIPLGSMRLHDQLVWDVNDSAADPDLFATAMCAEQSLDRAFAPLIAWHIRDQVPSPEALMHALPEWFDTIASLPFTSKPAQVYRFRTQARSKATLPPVNPVVLEKHQAPARRTRRKTAKQPADTGFANTYSSGV